MIKVNFFSYPSFKKSFLLRCDRQGKCSHVFSMELMAFLSGFLKITWRQDVKCSAVNRRWSAGLHLDRKWDPCTLTVQWPGGSLLLLGRVCCFSHNYYILYNVVTPQCSIHYLVWKVIVFLVNSHWKYLGTVEFVDIARSYYLLSS